LYTEKDHLDGIKSYHQHLNDGIVKVIFSMVKIHEHVRHGDMIKVIKGNGNVNDLFR